MGLYQQRTFLHLHIQSMNPESTYFTVYVLRCEQDKYYVGRVNHISNLSARLFDHFSPICSTLNAAWTRKYRPLEVIEIKNEQDKWAEDTYVYRFMDRYGVANVRGGTYSQVELSADQLRELGKKTLSVNDACYKCGKKGHFAKECESNKRKDVGDISSGSQHTSKRRHLSSISSLPRDDCCQRCGRRSHHEADCYARTHVDDEQHTHPSKRRRLPSSRSTECQRCGRASHDARHCYANTDVNGAEIEESEDDDDCSYAYSDDDYDSEDDEY